MLDGSQLSTFATTVFEAGANKNEELNELEDDKAHSECGWHA